MVPATRDELVEQMADEQAPAKEAPEEPQGPSAEDLEKLYDEANGLFAALWPMSCGKAPWQEQKVSRAGAVVSEIEQALRASVKDYDELMRVWEQDHTSQSDGLRLKADEAAYRNLADVQEDLRRMLSRR
jgi:hypothetical protein